MTRGPLKRRQLNRNRPIPRVANKAATNNPARVELERKLADTPVGQRPTDSDDSDRLVVKGNGRRGRNVAKQEIYATGAVGAGDEPGAYPSRAQRRRSLSRETNRILPRGHSSDRTDNHQELPRTSPLANGITNKTTSARRSQIDAATAQLSAVKVPGSILRPTLPTPIRETSILGTIKPRRRQPSILQNMNHDSSSFDLEDEDDFLPDDESTPLHMLKGQPKLSTPATTSTQSSSIRKRKLGQPDPLLPTGESSLRQNTTSPLATMRHPSPSPEPSLPALSLSSLRESGRKQRERRADKNDIMAPPQSSSSPAPSPVKTKTSAQLTKKSRKQTETKPIPLMTTEELQAALMPTRKRRTGRDRTQTLATEFDIPADSDSPVHEQDDDSNFLPQRKGRKPTRRKEPLRKPNNAGVKATGGKAGKATVAGKQNANPVTTAKTKSSTRNLITSTNTASAPILTPSTSSSRNRETKSPSQLLSTVANTTHSTAATANKKDTVSVSALARKPGRRYGGSRTRQAGPNLEDKENLHSSIASSPPEGSRGVDGDVGDDGGGDGDVAPIDKITKVSKGKWADIDAWDMDFEEVEVMTPSGSGGSSPLKR